MNKGTTLIDFVISMAIVATLFAGVYLVYFSIVNAVQNVDVRNAAVAVIDSNIEMVRNLPYASVGTVGGAPAGVIPQQQSVSYGKYLFVLQTVIRNIDDPFDGTIGGSPNDTSPADYKMVSIEADCPTCTHFIPITVTATVSPKNLEGATQNGSIFIYAIDANGNAVSDATVKVTNPTVSPSVNLTDTTNASGVLQLVGVPTSTQNYQIIVSKSGYSTDQTYPPGGAGNPNPRAPNITVVSQTLSRATLSIDRVSQVTVLTSDNRCRVVPSESFSVQGTKLIGTSPNVLKFSTSSVTSAGGSKVLSNVEWDTYTFGLSDAAENIVGTIPFSPMVVNPSSSVSFRFVLQPAQNPSLLVTVANVASGAGIPNATVTISKGAFSQTLTTNHAPLGQNDWSGGQYAGRSGGIAAGVPNVLTLALNASGTYTTSSTEWLVSNTFDLGGSSSTFYGISWTPLSQPPSTGAGSVEFQIAANNDNATWNFVGPNGASSFFDAPTTTMPASLNGNRYFRYKVFMSTQDPNASPSVTAVSIDSTADCVPPAQVFFGGLSQGTYTVNVTAVGYGAASTTVAVGSGAATTTVSLSGT